jgi:DNA-directed RNA polymerase subunit H (RpoH/RPB5)
VFRFYHVRELDADREVKKQVLEESGLKDEDLPWVTVADPFFRR